MFYVPQIIEFIIQGKMESILKETLLQLLVYFNPFWTFSFVMRLKQNIQKLKSGQFSVQNANF